MSEFKIEVVGRKGPRPKKPKPNGGKRPTILDARRTARLRKLRALLWLLKPRVATWGLAAIVYVVTAYGTPHLLVSFRCGGSGSHVHCASCTYFGLQGMRTQYGRDGACWIVTLLPVDWRAVRSLIVSRET
ncbi:hypothetical protein MALG_01480 [Marinovum algicola DG 898]|nr:hypothetical protein MALG_01480 [Marinovum algicola DG 898]